MNNPQNIPLSLFSWVTTSGIMVLGIIIGTFLLRSFANRFIEVVVHKAMKNTFYTDPHSDEQRAETIIKIFQNTLNVVVWILAGMMILSEMGVEIAPLIAAAGIAGVALGFGGQYLIRDVIAGFFTIAENQFRVGDIVEMGGVSGIVEDITLRMTTLRDLDGVVHHIPNGTPSVVSNKTKVFSRINLNIGIAYSTKLEHAIKVIDQVGKDLKDSKKWGKDILKTPKFLRVNEFADSAIVIKILGDTKPGRQWAVTGELRKRLKIAFDKEGIEIPFPQQVNHSSKD